MKLSPRQRNLLQRHQFCAIYAIGPDEEIAYSTVEQVDSLQQHVRNPLVGHNYQPGLSEFVTLARPVKLGVTQNPGESMAVTGDGWSPVWAYELLGRVWLEGRDAAKRAVQQLKKPHQPMRKAWIDIESYPGREMFDFELRCICRDLVGGDVYDDIGMLERLEELEWDLYRRQADGR